MSPRKCRCFVTFACLLAAAGSAWADYGPRELAEEKLVLKNPGDAGKVAVHVGEATDPACKVQAGANADFTITPETCKAVFEQTVPGTLKLKRGTAASEVKALSTVPCVEDEACKFTVKEINDRATAGTVSIYVFENDPNAKRWVKRLDYEASGAGGWASVVFYDGATLKQLVIKAAGPEPGSEGLTQMYAPLEECDPKSDLVLPSPLFVFEVLPGAITQIPCKGRQSTVIRVNTPVTVVVYFPSNIATPVIDMSGAIGLYEVLPRDEVKPHSGTNKDKPTRLRTESTLAPRLPGASHVTVTADGVSRPAKAEFIIEKTYSGALRIGVAAVFGGAQNRNYEAAMLPGSGQAEIVATEGGSMDAELVLGAAAFFDDGGRSYVAGDRKHWAPYVGIGILNKTETGLEVLNSIHFGVEYEISAQFSIAATVVGRRVTRLADGLEVGEPAPTGDLPTRDGFDIGFAVVFNLSTDFLKLAKSPGSSFFKNAQSEEE